MDQEFGNVFFPEFKPEQLLVFIVPQGGASLISECVVKVQLFINNLKVNKVCCFSGIKKGPPPWAGGHKNQMLWRELN